MQTLCLKKKHTHMTDDRLVRFDRSRDSLTQILIAFNNKIVHN